MRTLPLACLLAAIAASLPAIAADPADTRGDTALQELFKIDQNLMTLIALQQHAADQALDVAASSTNIGNNPRAPSRTASDLPVRR